MKLKTESCEKKPAEAKAQGLGEPTAAGMAVTQETLLVPRMVYVPFQQAVPIAPVRMTGAMAVGNGVQVQGFNQSAAQGASAKSASAQSAETGEPAVTKEQFLKLVQITSQLADRVDELNKRESAKAKAAEPIAPPKACPPGTTGQLPQGSAPSNAAVYFNPAPVTAPVPQGQAAEKLQMPLPSPSTPVGK